MEHRINKGDSYSVIGDANTIVFFAALSGLITPTYLLITGEFEIVSMSVYALVFRVITCIWVHSKTVNDSNENWKEWGSAMGFFIPSITLMLYLFVKGKGGSEEKITSIKYKPVNDNKVKLRLNMKMPEFKMKELPAQLNSKFAYLVYITLAVIAIVFVKYKLDVAKARQQWEIRYQQKSDY